MKHLLYLLVVVNLVYFSWQMLQASSDDKVADELLQLSPDTRRLMTLQELQEQREDQEPVGDAATQPAGRAEPPAEPESLAGIEALTEQQPPGAGLPLSCYTFGPILAESELKAALDRLEELGLKSTQRSTEEERQIGYWIYLPAMPRDKALTYKTKLDKHKDKEYFIGKDNVISLGAFREKSRADRRMKQLRKIGIKAVHEPRYKTRDVFWLDLVDGITASDHDRLSSEMSGLSMQPQACR